MAEHDNSYRKFFSSPQMVKDLLTGYIPQPWVAELDFDTMEAIQTSFVTDALRAREADIIWRIRWRDRWLYLYILIEMQSSVEPMMAVRVLTYIGLLYQDLIANKTLSPAGKLPPVLPIVLYNGKQPWTAPVDLAALIEPVSEPLRRYQPNMQYFLLDEGRLTEESHPKWPNLVSALIKLENNQDPARISAILEQLIQTLNRDDPEYRQLRRTFSEWLSSILVPPESPAEEIPAIQELSEVKVMLAERVLEWKDQWKREGKEEGRLEGKLEGKQEGRLEGKLEGKREGLEEGLTKVALNMLKDGDSLTRISKITGLSNESLQNLATENGIELQDNKLRH